MKYSTFKRKKKKNQISSDSNVLFKNLDVLISKHKVVSISLHNLRSTSNLVENIKSLIPNTLLSTIKIYGVQVIA